MSTHIHRNERPQRQRPPLPERLERLNYELKIEKTKSFDYINLVGPGFSIRVCVQRDLDGNFYASAQIGHAYRVQGGSPGGAVEMLKIAIKRDLNWKRRAEKETIKAIMDASL